ncbi:MAG: DUF1778 domain-containing protein [Agitococcus sp.]
MATALPRITARVDIDTQQLLSQAAAISGIASINSFVLNAAIEKAKQIIEQEQVLRLTEKDAMLLMDALDRPPRANHHLKAAAARYQARSQ